MIRTALILFALLIAPAAFAADDGGFGSQRFSSQTPSALSDDTPSSAFAKDETNPATIEPAAGAESDDTANPADASDPEALADEPDDAEDRPPAE